MQSHLASTPMALAYRQSRSGASPHQILSPNAIRQTMKTRTIKVNYLTRVEGEGAMWIKLKENQVANVKLKIFEPPRFFEAFLRGRNFTEADITARICGICPIAYEMSAIHAVENACGVLVNGPLRALRRLIYCGEWIESHILHIYLLHAPDFLGYESAIHMAQDFPELVQRGLQLKKVGNDIVTLLGGREIHPINIRPGGFYKLPSKADLLPLMELWRGAEVAIVIDAVSSGCAPGTIHRFDTAVQPIPAKFLRQSTHAFSLAEAIGLGRALNQLPKKLVVYGIEGKNFESCADLSEEANGAVDEVIGKIREEAEYWNGERSRRSSRLR